MDYKSQILEFLQDPKNLAIALDVVEYIEDLRPHLHQAFWKQIDQDLRARLDAESDLAGKWEISNKLNDDQQYINLRIQVKASKGSTLAVCLMQDVLKDKYHLFYGLCWAAEPVERKDPDSDTFRNLMNMSKDELSKSDSSIEEEKDGWWPMYIYLDIYPQSDEFMRSYGLHPAEFIEDLAGRMWGYFTALEPELYRLNQEPFEEK